VKMFYIGLPTMPSYRESERENASLLLIPGQHRATRNLFD